MSSLPLLRLRVWACHPTSTVRAPGLLPTGSFFRAQAMLDQIQSGQVRSGQVRLNESISTSPFRVEGLVWVCHPTSRFRVFGLPRNMSCQGWGCLNFAFYGLGFAVPLVIFVCSEGARTALVWVLPLSNIAF